MLGTEERLSTAKVRSVPSSRRTTTLVVPDETTVPLAVSDDVSDVVLFVLFWSLVYFRGRLPQSTARALARR